MKDFGTQWQTFQVMQVTDWSSMQQLPLQVALDIAVWGLQHVAHQCFAGQTAIRQAGGISALVKVPS